MFQQSLPMPEIKITITDIIKVQVSQVINTQENNPTSSPRKIEIITQEVTSYNSVSSIEHIREATKSHKFTASVNTSGSIFGAKASSSMGYELESLIKSYYKATGKVEAFKSKDTTRKDSYTLSPGDKMTVYTNTISGGGYEHSYDTFERLRNGAPTFVTIPVNYDLTHIFDELMLEIITVASGITTDAGEWAKYSAICQDAKIKGINTYMHRVVNELWITGLDQYSWLCVKNAARNGLKLNDDADALQTILMGFYNIISPSHNAGQWGALKSIGQKYLA